MALDRKKSREITGFTHAKQSVNATAWYGGAQSYHQAATLLYQSLENGIRASAFNAALSLELILKAIIVLQTTKLPPMTHGLRGLASEAKIKLSPRQFEILDRFTEVFEWVGRYPIPIKEGKWDEYYDDKEALRFIRAPGVVMAKRETFPSCENYNLVWNEFVASYSALTK